MRGSPTYLVPISGLFGAVLIIALILSGKIVAVGGIAFPAAVIIFPLSYVFGDVLTEVYGFANARRVVWAGFAAQLIWIVSYGIAAALPPAPFWPHQEAFEAVLGATPRIALAGVSAYLVGEFLNAYVLAKLKRAWRGGRLALRLIGSTMIGQAADTALFLLLAFGRVYPVADLVRIGVSVWVLKVLWEVVALPLSLALIRFLKRVEGEDAMDEGENFNPFRFGR